MRLGYRRTRCLCISPAIDSGPYHRPSPPSRREGRRRTGGTVPDCRCRTATDQSSRSIRLVGSQCWQNAKKRHVLSTSKNRSRKEPHEGDRSSISSHLKMFVEPNDASEEMTIMAPSPELIDRILEGLRTNSPGCTAFDRNPQKKDKRDIPPRQMLRHATVRALVQ